MNGLISHIGIIILSLIAIVVDSVLGIHIFFLILMMWWLNRAKNTLEYVVSFGLMIFHDVYMQLPLGTSGVIFFGLRFAMDYVFKSITSRKLRYIVLLLIFNLILFFWK